MEKILRRISSTDPIKNVKDQKLKDKIAGILVKQARKNGKTAFSSNINSITITGLEEKVVSKRGQIRRRNPYKLSHRRIET